MTHTAVRLRDLSGKDLFARPDSPEILNEKGYRLYQCGDAKRALGYLDRASRAGCGEAYLTLGLCLEYAFGQVKAAVQAYEAAVKKEVPRAYAELARCHLNGTGLPENPEKAYELAFDGAQKGDVLCHRLLGLMYRLGSGLPDKQPDFLLAQVAYTFAAHKGDPISCRALSDMNLQGEGYLASPEKAVHYKNLEFALISMVQGKVELPLRDDYLQAVKIVGPQKFGQILTYICSFIETNFDTFYFLKELPEHQQACVIKAKNSILEQFSDQANQLKAKAPKVVFHQFYSLGYLPQACPTTALKAFNTACASQESSLTPQRLRASLGLDTPLTRHFQTWHC